MTIPGTGETVGEAYIRIRADGSRLGRDIRDEFRGHDQAYRKAGREGAATYNKAFDDENDRWLKRRDKDGRVVSNIAKLTRDVNAAMRRNKAKFDSTGQFLAGGWAAKFKETLRKELGDNKQLADQVFNNISKAAERAGSRDVFFHRFANIGPEIARAREEIRKMEQSAVTSEARILRARLQSAEKFDRELTRITRSRHDLFGERDSKRLEQGIKQAVADMKNLDLSAAEADKRSRSLQRTLDSLTRTSDDLESGFFRVDHRLRGIVRHRNLKDLDDMDGLIRRGVRSTGAFERHLVSIERKVKDVKIGRFFGEGSRNNFFNALGKITGRLAEFTVLGLFRATRGMVGFVSGFRQADGVMGKTNFLVRALESTVLKLGKAFLGVGVALSALQIIGGPIAAFISDLGGVVTALAGTIVNGLIGGIGAALPILGALATGVGVVALAFAKGGKTYADWKKDLSKALGPVTSQFHKLQDAARAGLFPEINNAAPLLAKTLGRLDPLVTKIGRSLGKAFTGFLDNLHGPQFKKNLDSMEKFLPHAIEQLGKVATNVFGGIAGLLRALVPLANKLLDSWVEGSQRFRHFTNSGKGQNSIRDWFRDAYKSGQKLWQFVKDLGKVLFDLFTLGQHTGDNIFDSMNKSLEQFDAWLRSPTGITKVKHWFDDSRNMLTHLGNFVAGISHLFGKLAGGGQGEMNSILDGLGRLADLLAAALPAIQDFLSGAGGVLKLFFRALTDIASFISGHKDLFGPILASLGALWALLKVITIGGGIATAFRTIVGALTLGIANTVATITRGESQLTTAKQRLNVAMAGIGIGIAGITGGAQVAGPGGAAIGIGGGVLGGAIAGSTFGPIGTVVGGAVGGIVGGLVHLWGEANRAAEEAKRVHEQVIADIAAASERLVNTLQQDANSIGQLTKTQIAADLNQKAPDQKLSALDAAEVLGFKGSDIVDAISGEKPKLLAALQAQMDLLGSSLGSQQTNFLAKHPVIATQIGNKVLDPNDVPFLKHINEQADAINSLRAALERESGALKQSILNTDRVNSAAKNLDLSTRDVATQFLVYGKRLNGASVAAQRNREFISDHIDALKAQTAQMLRQKQPAADVAKAYLTGAQNLEKQLRQAGFMGPAVDALVQKYGKLPKDVITKLEADPSDANKKIAENLFKLGLIPPSVLTKIVGKDEASHVIDGVKSNLNTITDKVVEIQAVKAPGFDSYLQLLRNEITGTVTYIPVGVNRVGPGTGRGVNASGRILNRATKITAGEAGAEAIVPLHRPLSQVDPSVRWLSAIAQGMDPDSRDMRMARGGTVTPAMQKVVNIEAGAIQVITPTTDPMAVAVEAVNQLAQRVSG